MRAGGVLTWGRGDDLRARLAGSRSHSDGEPDPGALAAMLWEGDEPDHALLAVNCAPTVVRDWPSTLFGTVVCRLLGTTLVASHPWSFEGIDPILGHTVLGRFFPSGLATYGTILCLPLFLVFLCTRPA